VTTVDTTFQRLFSLQFMLGHLALRQQFLVLTELKRRICNNWTVHSPCYWNLIKASGYPTVERGTFRLQTRCFPLGAGRYSWIPCVLFRLRNAVL